MIRISFFPYRLTSDSPRYCNLSDVQKKYQILNRVTFINLYGVSAKGKYQESGLNLSFD
jgi:hypothetical protein